MTDKKYADMTTIMEYCRIWADQMYKCLQNNDLSDFHIEMIIGNWKLENGNETSLIEFEKDIMTTPEDEYDSKRMSQMKMDDGKGWFVCHDPKAKAGTVPPTVRYIENKRTVCKAEGENTTKPLPPDGMWIGDPRNDPPVDSGV